jgi:predicted anti-sigma-YlaC factor YlaD
MNHRPFEDWLLNGEPLSPTQTRDLYNHLAGCPDCSALMEVNAALNLAQLAKPAPGFGARFGARLEAQRARQRRRALWGIFFLGLASAGVMLLLALRFLPGLPDTLLDLVVGGVPFILSIFNSANILGRIGAVFVRVVAGFVPNYAWFLAALLTTFFGWLWVVTISRYVRVPQEGG